MSLIALVSTRAYAPVLAAIMGCALLSGCAGTETDKGDASGEPSVGDIPVLLETAGLELPLDTYLTTARQRAVLDQAQDVLTERCMARFGFTYAAPRAPTTSASASSSSSADGQNARRYGLTDPEAASRSGYFTEAATEPAKPGTAGLSATAERVLYGSDDDEKSLPASQEEAEAATAKNSETVGGQKVPAGGCQREAYLKLYAPKKNAVDIMFTQGLSFESSERATRDSRVETARERWSTCMKEKGYATTDPLKVPSQLGLTELRGQKAIAAAVQDVACKKKVNLVGIWSTVEAAYQERLIEKNAETLTLAKEQQEDRIKLANQLMGKER
ncbi:hypothetical protein GCM10023080_071950 [Streptomyces pseudoechinosporeus]